MCDNDGMSNTAIRPLLNPTKILATEKRNLCHDIQSSLVLTGQDRTKTVGRALSLITEILWNRGFSLDMVSILPSATKGSLCIPFRRSSEEDSMSDIVNAAISFTWENLGTQFEPRFEFIAYVA